MCGNRAKWVRQANLLGSPQQTPNETQEDGGAVQDGQSTLMKAEICSPQSRLNSVTFPKHPLKPPANRRRGEWRVQENDAEKASHTTCFLFRQAGGNVFDGANHFRAAISTPGTHQGTHRRAEQEQEPEKHRESWETRLFCTTQFSISRNKVTWFSALVLVFLPHKFAFDVT